MGVPGRSNAFDISKKLGLGLNIINKAKTMIGTDEQEINSMIESLERNSKRVDEQRIELDRLVREAQETHDALAKQYQQYQNYEQSLMNEAKKMIGVPYKWGGTTPSGFDCSGFIFYVYDKAGYDISRNSAQGYFDRSYYVDKPQVGDLVFFKNTYKQGISHVGIYVGNNQFINASSSGVEITSLGNSYWSKYFDSYKRFY